MVLFAAGIVLSLIGSLPPGLISLAVARTSMMRGFLPAIVFAWGAAFAEFFQAVAAVVFAKWFLEHPVAAKIFQMIAIPIFLGIAVYLWFFAKAPKTPPNSKLIAPGKQFFSGVVISVFNLLAIPYWVAYAGWLQINGYWQDGWIYIILFAAGVTVGTMIALSLYAWLASELIRRSDEVAKYVNRLVALIFLGLGIKLIIDFL